MHFYNPRSHFPVDPETPLEMLFRHIESEVRIEELSDLPPPKRGMGSRKVFSFCRGKGKVSYA